MRVYRVEADNFLSYGKGFELDVPPGMVAVTGHNGAGKSSLIDLITWTLFGEGRYNDVDAYVRQGATEARSTVYLELGREKYRVTRTRTLRKKSGLQVQRIVDVAGPVWQAIELATIAEAEAFLQRCLGVNYGALTSTSFVLQGEAAAFTAATPARRKEILLEVLDVGRYESLQVRAKERRDHDDQAIAVAKASVERLATALSERPDREERLALSRSYLAGLRQAITENVAELAVAEEQVVQTASALNMAQERVKQHLAAKARVARITQELADARRAVEARTISPDELGFLRASITLLEQTQQLADEEQARKDRVVALQQKLHEAERLADQDDGAHKLRVEKLNRTIEQTEAQVLLIQESGCDSPTRGAHCGFLQAAHIASARLPELRFQHAEAVAAVVDRGRIEALKAEIDAVGYDASRLERARYEIGRLKPQAEQARKLEVMEAERQTLVQTVADSERRLAEAVSELAEAAAAMGQGIDGAMQAERYARYQRDRVKARLSDLREEEGANLAAIARHEEALEQMDKAEAELVKAERVLETLGVERAAWAYLTQAYGRDGIPTMILKRAIPAIRDDANRLLERMFGGRLWVDFITETETKTTKAARDTFEIVVSDTLGSRPYAGWSGAERLAVDLAVRAALSRLLAARSGAAIRTFVMDEGAGALDPERLEAFVAAVRGLAQWFDAVLLVTHIPALRDQFPQRVEFEKGAEGSVARITEA